LSTVGLDDLRSTIFMRLLSIAKKKSDGTSLTDVEQTALDAFSQLIVDRRVRAMELALEEYARWDADPCRYQVPDGFGFKPYNLDSICRVPPNATIAIPKPPSPTNEQFVAYGVARTLKEAQDQIAAAKRAALGTIIDELFLERKTEKALMKDVSAAFDAVARNRPDKACRELTQPIKQTLRDHRNALTAVQENTIVTTALRIEATLGCR
jgi:hypothetical protein